MSKKGIKAGSTYVEAYLDDSRLVRGLKGMGTRIKSAGTSAMTAGAGLLGLGAGIGAAFIKPLQAAGRMSAVMASFDTIFKSGAKGMGEWADSFAQSLGRSKTDVRDFMTQTQGRLLGAEVDDDTASDINKQLTARAFDMAQFWDKDDAQAVQAMQNALTGEMEMLKQFGVVISQADVDAKLKAMGLDPKTASQAEKVQARFAVMMQKTAEVEGTAAREAGEFGSLMKQLDATVKDLSESIGMVLLPVITPLIGQASKMVGTVAEWVKANPWLVSAVAGLAVGLVALGAVLIVAGALANGFVGMMTMLGMVLSVALSPIGAVVLGVGAIVGVLTYAAYETGLLTQAFNWLMETCQPLIDALKRVWDAMKNAFAAGELGKAVNVLWAAIKLAFAKGIGWVLEQWHYLIEGMQMAFRAMVNAIVSLFEGLLNNILAGMATAYNYISKVAQKMGVDLGTMTIRQISLGRMEGEVDAFEGYDVSGAQKELDDAIEAAKELKRVESEAAETKEEKREPAEAEKPKTPDAPEVKADKAINSAATVNSSSAMVAKFLSQSKDEQVKILKKIEKNTAGSVTIKEGKV